MQEVAMIRARVEYDKYNRTFRLLDRGFASTLEDGVQYELVLPLTVVGLDNSLARDCENDDRRRPRVLIHPEV
jgi:hypothetical protein